MEQLVKRLTALEILAKRPSGNARPDVVGVSPKISGSL